MMVRENLISVFCLSSVLCYNAVQCIVLSGWTSIFDQILKQLKHIEEQLGEGGGAGWT